jgi:hypothetical protein
MMLVCPVTTERQIAQLQEAFAEVAGTLVA